MSLIRSLRSRLSALFRKRKLDAEMDEEMRLHLELLTEHNIEAGMSSEEARYAAQRKFGGVEQIKERGRDERGFLWIEQFFQDLRYAARQLRRSPGFTMVAVFSLAIGISANAVVFNLIDEVLFRALPVVKPQELVLFRWVGELKRAPLVGIWGAATLDKPTGLQTSPFFSFAAFERFREAGPALREVFAFAPLGTTLVIDGRTENPRGQVVTGNYFVCLGVQAAQGRLLLSDDDRPEAAPVAVISYDFWQSRLGGSADIVGKIIKVNEVAFTIVGVTPRGFAGTTEFGQEAAVTIAMAMMPRLQGDQGYLRRPLVWWVNIMGRLRPGVELITAQTQLDTIFVQATTAAWQAGEAGIPGKILDGYKLPRLQLDPGEQGLTGTRHLYAQPLWILGCIMSGVLLLACFNLMNLLLARVLARGKEIAVRLALGAGRGRVIRQLVTENLLLSCLGGGFGWVLALSVHQALLQFWPIGGNSDFLGQIFVFVFILSLLVGLACGSAPAWWASRLNVETALKSGSGGAVGTPRRRFRRGLMVVQVAIAVVLLVGTGLFLCTLRNFATLDVGFERDHLAYFRLGPGASRTTPPQKSDLYRRLQETIDGLPGVQSSALVARPLLSGSRSEVKIVLNNPALPPGQSMQTSTNAVSASFFQTLGIGLRLGRTFTPGEVEANRDVAVVNEAFAHTFFPKENPVGRTFTLPGQPLMHTPDRVIEIIGVAADARYADLRAAIPPVIYQPLVDRFEGAFVVRTTDRPSTIMASLQAAVRKLAPDARLFDLRTQQETVDQLLTTERLFTLICVAFTVVALALTCLGLYGLLSHDVVVRTREIGIRIALGSAPRGVVTLMIVDGMKPVLIGLGLGLASALALTRFIAAMLFNVSASDPATFVGTAILFIGIAVVACWLPARRAAKVDPMVALRAE